MTSRILIVTACNAALLSKLEKQSREAGFEVVPAETLTSARSVDAHPLTIGEPIEPIAMPSPQQSWRSDRPYLKRKKGRR